MSSNCSSSQTPTQEPIEATRQWIERFVVGLNLCPFAAPVVKDDKLHIDVCDAVDTDAILNAVLQQLDMLQQNAEQEIATSLLVFSDGLKDFEQFWALVEVAEQLVAEVQLEGVIQLASFHPHYIFEGEDIDDVSHYTNRSPYPMLHFIREEQLARALESFPNPQEIPTNNIQRLRDLGKHGIEKLLKLT